MSSKQSNVINIISVGIAALSIISSGIVSYNSLSQRVAVLETTTSMLIKNVEGIKDQMNADNQQQSQIASRFEDQINARLNQLESKVDNILGYMKSNA